MNRLAGWSIFQHENYLDDWNRSTGGGDNRIKRGDFGGDTDSKGGILIVGFLLLQGIALYFTLRKKG